MPGWLFRFAAVFRRFEQSKAKRIIISTYFAVLVLLLALLLILSSLQWPNLRIPLNVKNVDNLRDLLNTAAAIVTGVATLLLAVFACFGLQQLRLAKKDIRIRSQREARTSAIAHCECLRKELMPRHSNIRALLSANTIPAPIIPPDVLDGEHPGLPLLQEIRIWLSVVPAETQTECVDLLNELETWSMAFTHLIADAGVAFPPASGVYCKMVVTLYPLVVMLRYKEPHLFPNLRTLFVDWQSRIEGRTQRAQLALAMRQIRLMNKRAPLANTVKPHPRPLGDEN